MNNTPHAAKNAASAGPSDNVAANASIPTPRIGNAIPDQKYLRYLPRVISQVASRAWALPCVKDTSPQIIKRCTTVPARTIQSRGVISAIVGQARAVKDVPGLGQRPAKGESASAPSSSAWT